MENIKYYLAASHDAAYNLSAEELLVKNKVLCVFLWINSPVVVIGRNQNPYSECNLARMREDSIALMRRKSGGGAVYHDLGNINFTIISKKTPDTLDKSFSLVIKALSLLGIKATISGRNDLEVDGKKISGSAFFEEDGIYMHHGTLLVSSAINELAKYLEPNKLKLESKGIKSVKSRVTNLNEINPSITIDRVIDSFSSILGTKPHIIPANIEKINRLALEYKSYKWLYGEAMDYNMSLKDKFKWGLIEIRMSISNGLIKNIELTTDSIILDGFKELEKALIGKALIYSDIEKECNSYIKNSEIKADILKLFKIS